MFTYSTSEHQQGSAISDLYDKPNKAKFLFGPSSLKRPAKFDILRVCLPEKTRITTYQNKQNITN